MDLPASLQDLVTALRVLPGVGPRSASRMAYHLLQHDPDGARRLARAVDGALDRLRPCRLCNSFSERETCGLCASTRRDRRLLCVVEMPADLAMVEQSGAFPGLYFVLMGRLSPLDGVGPEEIRLDRLVARAADGVVKEVILATNFTVEGEATAHYIAEILRSRGLKVSRIARGLPVGGELEHSDVSTLAQAIVDRRGAA